MEQKYIYSRKVGRLSKWSSVISEWRWEKSLLKINCAKEWCGVSCYKHRRFNKKFHSVSIPRVLSAPTPPFFLLSLSPILGFLPSLVSARIPPLSSRPVFFPLRFVLDFVSFLPSPRFVVPRHRRPHRRRRDATKIRPALLSHTEDRETGGVAILLLLRLWWHCTAVECRSIQSDLGFTFLLCLVRRLQRETSIHLSSHHTTP